MLTGRERLRDTHEVDHNIDNDIVLLHELDSICSWRYDIRLRQTKVDRRVEHRLSFLNNEDPRADGHHNLKSIEAKSTKAEYESSLRLLDFGGALDGMVCCETGISRNGGLW